MKFHREKWFRGRLYEIYFHISLDSFYVAIQIADVDFEIHLHNFRYLKELERS